MFAFKKFDERHAFDLVTSNELAESGLKTTHRDDKPFQMLKLRQVSDAFVRLNRYSENTNSEIMVFQICLEQYGSIINKLTFVNLPIGSVTDSQVTQMVEHLNNPTRHGGKSKLLQFIGNDGHSKSVNVLCHFMKESVQYHLKNGKGLARGLFRQVSIFGQRTHFSRNEDDKAV